MTTPPALDLDDRLKSWYVHLKAERKSPRTVETYTSGVRLWLRWCHEGDHPTDITKASVNAWIADLLDNGGADNSAVSRQAAVRRFSAWLTEEGHLPADPLLGLKAPAIDEKVTDPLSPDEIRAMIATCAGKDFRSRRDEAIIRLMFETGARAGEAIGMELPDVDVKAGMALVKRGKGGKGRRVPFGAQTARALDRYLTLRKPHRLAGTGKLWLGERGAGFSYSGLRKSLQGRAEAAGIADFHPHRLRHSFADAWLSADGSEGGLMSLAGWSDARMLRRYTKARASQRAADESRKLNLGDL